MTTGQFAYFQKRIVPIEEARVSVMTNAFNYGTAVFGGMRAYWNETDEQLFVVRPREHFQRLIQSAGLLHADLGHSPDSLTEILLELLRRENYRTNVYIRPLIYAASERIGVHFQDLEFDLAIFTLPSGQYIENDEGSHVCFSSWSRIQDNTIPARGKIAGAYVNSALIRTDALNAGYDDALVLNTDGHIAEGSVANFMMVRDGVVITPPVSANILEGITRRTLIELLRNDLGVTVTEREIDRTEIYIADEAFLCGTGLQIAAITRVEHRPIGRGTMGPITQQLRQLYFDVVHGRSAAYRHWLAPVYSHTIATESEAGSIKERAADGASESVADAIPTIQS